MIWNQDKSIREPSCLHPYYNGLIQCISNRWGNIKKEGVGRRGNSIFPTEYPREMNNAIFLLDHCLPSVSLARGIMVVLSTADQLLHRILAIDSSLTAKMMNNTLNDAWSIPDRRWRNKTQGHGAVGCYWGLFAQSCLFMATRFVHRFQQIKYQSTAIMHGPNL